MCDLAGVAKPFLDLWENGLLSRQKLTAAITAMYEEGQHSKFQFLSYLIARGSIFLVF
jgi:hypothetical protein